MACHLRQSKPTNRMLLDARTAAVVCITKAHRNRTAAAGIELHIKPPLLKLLVPIAICRKVRWLAMLGGRRRTTERSNRYVRIYA